MREADWTYEAPPGGSDTIWLESYAVYDSDGEPLGKVLTVLEHEGRVYLAVEGSPVPLKHDRWAVPFDLVGQIDDQDLGVVLRISAEAP